MKHSQNRLRRLWLYSLSLFASSIFVLPSLAVPPSVSDTSQIQSVEQVEKPGPSADERPIAQNKSSKWVRARILMPEGTQAEDFVYTPFLFWRAWIHQKLPCHRVFWGMIFVLTPLCFIFPRTLKASVERYRVRWLKSFGIGIGSFTFALIVEATLARMGLFFQLSVLMLALLEFLAIGGLLVAAQAVGSSAFNLLRLSNRPANQIARTILTLWTGIFLLSLLVLMPNVGILQELGKRMLALLAATGAGAIILHLHSLAPANRSQ